MVAIMETVTLSVNKVSAAATTGKVSVENVPSKVEVIIDEVTVEASGDEASLMQSKLQHLYVFLLNLVISFLQSHK